MSCKVMRKNQQGRLNGVRDWTLTIGLALI